MSRSATVDTAQVKREPVCVIGAGPAGLVTAQVFLRDGFEDVQVLCKDSSVGGAWSRERIYPTMNINNVHGEFRFSSHPMPPPPDAAATGGRLRGRDICEYMESFHDRWLRPSRAGGQPRSIVRFNTEVVCIERGPGARGWNLFVRDTKKGPSAPVEGNTIPRWAVNLSPHDARQSGYDGPVIHSNESWPKVQTILDAAQAAKKPAPDSEGGEQKKGVVVVGGGKSAQDVSVYLSKRGARVTMVYETTELSLSSPKPAPDFIRRSRLLSVFSPYMDLNTRFERFLHTTWLGAHLVRFFWNTAVEDSFSTYSVPQDSPLRKVHSIYWDVRTGDDGVRRDDSFMATALKGDIKVVAPMRVSGFYSDGVVLSSGERLEAGAVVVCSGYSSSWKPIISDELSLEIGLTQLVSQKELDQFSWDYASLADPPNTAKEYLADPVLAPGSYKGLVPAKSIFRRDIAVNGSTFTSNTGYSLEIGANWVSTYFLGHKLKLPQTVEEATHYTHRDFAWARKRYPGFTGWSNTTNSSVMPYFGIFQWADGLLDDMFLPAGRGGGNWLTWAFTRVSIDELKDLGEERRKRQSGDN